MKHVNLADAKARLSAFVDQAEAGESVAIVRRGKTAAKLVPAERAKTAVDLTALQALAAQLPKQSKSAQQSIRSMRDAERY